MSIETLFLRWVNGNLKRFPRDEYPAEWQPLLAGLSDQNAALNALGLFSHYQGFHAVQSDYPLTPRPPLPKLDRPLVPKEALSLLETCQTYFTRSNTSLHEFLFDFIHRNGFCFPPDWFFTDKLRFSHFFGKHCSPVDKLEFYQPWLSRLDPLLYEKWSYPRWDMTTWLDWLWRFCRTSELLQHLPVRQAKAVVKAHLNRHPPWTYRNSGSLRFLNDHLSADDEPFLKSLLQSPEDWIRKEARWMLLAIRIFSPDGESFQRDYFKKELYLNDGKFHWRTNNRDPLFPLVMKHGSLAALASAFDLQPEEVVTKISAPLLEDSTELALLFIASPNNPIDSQLTVSFIHHCQPNKSEYWMHNFWRNFWSDISPEQRRYLLLHTPILKKNLWSNAEICFMQTQRFSDEECPPEVFFNSPLWRIFSKKSNHYYQERPSQTSSSLWILLGLWLPPKLRRAVYERIGKRLSKDACHYGFLLGMALEGET